MDIIPASFSHTAAPIVGAVNMRFLAAFQLIDTADAGPYRVSGTLGIDASPDIMVHRKVRLICKRSGRLVRETWSDPVTGAYVFDRVRRGPWTVLAHDYTGVYNAVVADNKLGDLP